MDDFVSTTHAQQLKNNIDQGILWNCDIYLGARDLIGF